MQQTAYDRRAGRRSKPGAKREREILAGFSSSTLYAPTRAAIPPPPPSRRDELENHLVRALQSSLTYWKCKRAVKEEIAKKPTKYETDELSTTIPVIMEEIGMATQMRNMVYNLYRNANHACPSEQLEPPLPVVEEPLDGVNQARLQWESGIAQELHVMAAEQGASLCQPNELHDENGGSESSSSSASAGIGSAGSASRQAPRFLFDSADLLDAIQRIKSPNRVSVVSQGLPQQWGMIKVQLKTPTMAELKHQFSALHPSQRQVGLDDVIADIGTASAADKGYTSQFFDECYTLGTKASTDGYIPIAREYAKRGLPAALRPAVWSRVLELSLGGKELNHFELLTKQSGRWSMVTDPLFKLDCKRVADDDSFFPFEEILDQVTSVFVSDSWVQTNAEYRVHEPVVDPLHGVSVPLCGVQPFLGFVNYIAPLCYLFQRPEPMYFTFRMMWCRYWCRLNCIRSHQQTLLPLCRMFEELLQAHEPQLFYHLLKLGVNPLQLAFPWIQLAFTDTFEVEQVLLLWDRILGFDNLNVLPVLAAALFAFRSESLMAAEDAAEVNEIMSEFKRIKVVPLLQHFLFSDAPQA